MALRRGIAALVIALIGLPLLVFAAAVVFLYMVATRGPAVPDQATLVLRPGGDRLDLRPDDIVGQLAGRDATTLRSLVESLRKAKRDPRIAGLAALSHHALAGRMPARASASTIALTSAPSAIQARWSWISGWIRKRTSTRWSPPVQTSTR